MTTKQETAVILSADSDNGSIEIGIQSKRPYVKYKISSGPSEKLISTVRVNDLKIHTLRASQVGDKIRFSVDQELALEGRYRSPKKFNFNFENIKIGQKWENSNEIEKLVGFRGCLYQGNCFTGTFHWGGVGRGRGGGGGIAETRLESKVMYLKSSRRIG